MPPADSLTADLAADLDVAFETLVVSFQDGCIRSPTGSAGTGRTLRKSRRTPSSARIAL